MYIYYMYVHKYEVHVSIVQILQREIHYYEHTTQYNVTQQPSPPPQFGPSLLLKKGGGSFQLYMYRWNKDSLTNFMLASARTQRITNLHIIIVEDKLQTISSHRK